MNVFHFGTYRAFIKDRIQAFSESRGYQGQLADIAQCQKSYFSNVLSGKVNLSAEQAAARPFLATLGRRNRLLPGAGEPGSHDLCSAA
jgi:hypothetical protein